jgi:hypothetical protein
LQWEILSSVCTRGEEEEEEEEVVVMEGAEGDLEGDEDSPISLHQSGHCKQVLRIRLVFGRIRIRLFKSSGSGSVYWTVL